MDHHLRGLIAELIAAKSAEEVERALGVIRAHGEAALRAAATVLAESYLSLRLQRAAVALAAEVGGEEGVRLLRVLLTASNVDDEEQAAAVRGLGTNTSPGTLALLLDLLAVGGSGNESECDKAIFAQLARVPAEFDWRPVMDAVPSSRLNDLRQVLGRAATPALAVLVAAVDMERRTRRGAVGTDSLQAGPSLGSSYPYAVPTGAALRLAADHAPLLEIGAGSGYWAWLLRQMHVDVVAYDREPPDGTYRNPYFEGGHTWTEVREGGPEAIHEHVGRTLFLCWPPPGTPMAEQCLAAFQGDVVLFAGEWRGACATPAFFDALEASFMQVAAVSLPSGDELRAFQRRGR